jgi:hypothetical protein
VGLLLSLLPKLFLSLAALRQTVIAVALVVRAVEFAVPLCRFFNTTLLA